MLRLQDHPEYFSTDQLSRSLSVLSCIISPEPSTSQSDSTVKFREQHANMTTPVQFMFNLCLFISKIRVACQLLSRIIQFHLSGIDSSLLKNLYQTFWNPNAENEMLNLTSERIDCLLSLVAFLLALRLFCVH